MEGHHRKSGKSRRHEADDEDGAYIESGYAEHVDPALAAQGKRRRKDHGVKADPVDMAGGAVAVQGGDAAPAAGAEALAHEAAQHLGENVGVEGFAPDQGVFHPGADYPEQYDNPFPYDHVAWVDPSPNTVVIEGRIFRREDFEVEADFEKLLAIKRLAMSRPPDVPYVIPGTDPHSPMNMPGGAPAKPRKPRKKKGADPADPFAEDGGDDDPPRASSHRRANVRWTPEQTRCLERGLILFSGTYGDFASTMRMFPNEFAGRRNQDLKDKARNQRQSLIKAGAALEEVAPYLRGLQTQEPEGRNPQEVAFFERYPPELVQAYLANLRAAVMAELGVDDEDVKKVAKSHPLDKVLPAVAGDPLPRVIVPGMNMGVPVDAGLFGTH